MEFNKKHFMKACMVCGAVVTEEKYIKRTRDGKEFEWEEVFCCFECYLSHCRKNNWEHFDQMAALVKEKGYKARHWWK